MVFCCKLREDFSMNAGVIVGATWGMHDVHCVYTVPKEIDFPRYNMKCSGKNAILRGIFHVVSGFPLHFMLYHGNLDCFLTVYSKLKMSFFAELGTRQHCRDNVTMFSDHKIVNY